MKILLWVLFLINISTTNLYADAIFGADGEVIYKLNDQKEEGAIKNNQSSENKIKLNSKYKPVDKSFDRKGNLPSYLANRRYSNMSNISTLTTVGNSVVRTLKSAKIGDKYSIRVLHGVLAFPGEKSPAVAIVTQSGSLKDARLVGFTFLELNTKKVCFNFKTITQGDVTYNIEASGIDIDEQMCIKGQYHSQETEIFAGAFISSFIGAYFDAKAPSGTNVFGLETKDTSTEAAFKKGLGGAATRTADELYRKIQKSPEFSEVKGPFQMKIIVLSQAKETDMKSILK